MNHVALMGRLTKDVELRYTQSNMAVASFTLAVDRYVGEGKEKQADFFPVIAWGKLGETCNKYLGKGRRVVIMGRLQTRNWDDSEGKKHYVTEIVASEMHFADSKKEDGGQQQAQRESPHYRQTPAAVPAAGGEKPPWM